MNIPVTTKFAQSPAIINQRSTTSSDSPCFYNITDKFQSQPADETSPEVNLSNIFKEFLTKKGTKNVRELWNRKYHCEEQIPTQAGINQPDKKSVLVLSNKQRGTGVKSQERDFTLTSLNVDKTVKWTTEFFGDRVKILEDPENNDILLIKGTITASHQTVLIIDKETGEIKGEKKSTNYDYLCNNPLYFEDKDSKVYCAQAVREIPAWKAYLKLDDLETGEEKWRVSLYDKEKEPNFFKMPEKYSYNLLNDPKKDAIYLMDDVKGRILSIDKKTGKTNWELSTEDKYKISIYPPVLTRDGKIVFIADNGELIGINSDTGTEEWNYEGNTRFHDHIKLDDEGRVFLKGTNKTSPPYTDLTCIDTKTGKCVWTYEFDKNYLASGRLNFDILPDGDTAILDRGKLIILNRAGNEINNETWKPAEDDYGVQGLKTAGDGNIIVQSSSWKKHSMQITALKVFSDKQLLEELNNKRLKRENEDAMKIIKEEDRVIIGDVSLDINR
jgi:outer membrane protein assembly factor BamB